MFDSHLPISESFFEYSLITLYFFSNAWTKYVLYQLTGIQLISIILIVYGQIKTPVHPKLYLPAGFHCSLFCAQTSCRKFKIYTIIRAQTSLRHKCLAPELWRLKSKGTHNLGLNKKSGIIFLGNIFIYHIFTLLYLFLSWKLE